MGAGCPSAGRRIPDRIAPVAANLNRADISAGQVSTLDAGMFVKAVK